MSPLSYSKFPYIYWPIFLENYAGILIKITSHLLIGNRKIDVSKTLYQVLCIFINILDIDTNFKSRAGYYYLHAANNNYTAMFTS